MEPDELGDISPRTWKAIANYMKEFIGPKGLVLI
jgi:hypothetical protein